MNTQAYWEGYFEKMAQEGEYAFLNRLAGMGKQPLPAGQPELPATPLQGLPPATGGSQSARVPPQSQPRAATASPSPQASSPYLSSERMPRMEEVPAPGAYPSGIPEGWVQTQGPDALGGVTPSGGRDRSLYWSAPQQPQAPSAPQTPWQQQAYQLNQQYIASQSPEQRHQLAAALRQLRAQHGQNQMAWNLALHRGQ